MYSIITLVFTLQLQSKRELFFKNELPAGGAAPGAPTAAPGAPPPAVPNNTTPNNALPNNLKEALAKRTNSTDRGEFSVEINNFLGIGTNCNAFKTVFIKVRF